MEYEGQFPNSMRKIKEEDQRERHTQGSAKRANGPEKAWNRSKKRHCTLTPPLEVMTETTETNTHMDRVIKRPTMRSCLSRGQDIWKTTPGPDDPYPLPDIICFIAPSGPRYPPDAGVLRTEENNCREEKTALGRKFELTKSKC